MNRRIRSRTYGGVRGREPIGSLLLDTRVCGCAPTDGEGPVNAARIEASSPGRLRTRKILCRDVLFPLMMASILTSSQCCPNFSANSREVQPRGLRNSSHKTVPGCVGLRLLGSIYLKSFLTLLFQGRHSNRRRAATLG